jgi:hypothetical protein
MSTQTSISWRRRLDDTFTVLEKRRTLSLRQGPVPEDEFLWFVQNVAIPAFQLFRDALAEHADVPEYAEGEDWVAFRWADGHTLSVNPLLRAPGRAAAALNFTSIHRAGHPDLHSLGDVQQDDVLHWLVREYARWRRVGDAEMGQRDSDSSIKTV